jgi:hypothetical protein
MRLWQIVPDLSPKPRLGGLKGSMNVVLHEIDLLDRFTSAQLAASAVGLRFTACPRHLLLQERK